MRTTAGGNFSIVFPPVGDDPGDVPEESENYLEQSRIISPAELGSRVRAPCRHQGEI